MEAVDRYTLGKSERLYGKREFEELMSSGKSFMVYPLRVIWRLESRGADNPPVRIAVSVSKRRFKRAVKRNRVKRLVREAYRLHKYGFHPLVSAGQTLDLLFIYVHDELPDYARIEKAIVHAIRKTEKRLAPGDNLDSSAAD